MLRRRLSGVLDRRRGLCAGRLRRYPALGRVSCPAASAAAAADHRQASRLPDVRHLSPPRQLQHVLVPYTRPPGCCVTTRRGVPRRHSLHVGIRPARHHIRATCVASCVYQCPAIWFTATCLPATASAARAVHGGSPRAWPLGIGFWPQGMDVIVSAPITDVIVSTLSVSCTCRVACCALRCLLHPALLHSDDARTESTFHCLTEVFVLLVILYGVQVFRERPALKHVICLDCLWTQFLQ